MAESELEAAREEMAELRAQLRVRLHSSTDPVSLTSALCVVAPKFTALVCCCQK